MNKVVLMGRLTNDPEIRYSQGENAVCIASFTLAVDRRFKREDDPSADFIRCVAFGKTAELIEKYIMKGKRVCISGRIQTGSYTNRDGVKVYTTDVVIEEFDFADSRTEENSTEKTNKSQAASQAAKAPSMPEPDPDLDEDLPFN